MKELEIRLKLDKSQAEAATTAHLNNVRKIEKAHQANAAASSRATEADRKGFRAASGAADSLADSLKGVASQLFGVQLIGAAAQAMSQTMEQARKHADELADRFIRQRDALREIAALSGGQANNRLTLDTARFNARTGLREDESRSFVTEFLNAGAQNIGPGKSLGNVEAERYKLLVGQLAAAKGLEPGVVGNLAGSALAFHNFAGNKQGADEATVSLNRAMTVMESGQGNSPVLARQLQMLSAATVNEDDLQGIFPNLEEAAIAISVGAEKHDAQSAEMVMAGIRGLYDKRPKTEEFNQKAGITNKTPFFERIQKISDLIDKEATPQGIRPGQYLTDTFEDSLTRNMIETFVNRGVKGGVIKTRRETLAGLGDPQQVNKLVGTFQNDVEGAGPTRIAEAQKIQAENERAADRAMLVTLRHQAETVYEQSRIDDDPAANVGMGLFDVVGTPFRKMGLLPTAKESAIRGVMKQLIDQRGLDQGKKLPDSMTRMPGTEFLGYGGTFTNAGEDQAMIDAMKSINAAGGNALVGVMKENNRLVAENNRLLGKENQKPANPPGPKPIPAPTRGAPPVQTR